MLVTASMDGEMRDLLFANPSRVESAIIHNNTPAKNDAHTLRIFPFPQRTSFIASRRHKKRQSPIQIPSESKSMMHKQLLITLLLLLLPWCLLAQEEEAHSYLRVLVPGKGRGHGPWWKGGQKPGKGPKKHKARGPWWKGGQTPGKGPKKNKGRGPRNLRVLKPGKGKGNGPWWKGGEKPGKGPKDDKGNKGQGPKTDKVSVRFGSKLLNAARENRKSNASTRLSYFPNPLPPFTKENCRRACEKPSCFDECKQLENKPRGRCMPPCNAGKSNCEKECDKNKSCYNACAKTKMNPQECKSICRGTKRGPRKVCMQDCNAIRNTLFKECRDGCRETST